MGILLKEVNPELLPFGRLIEETREKLRLSKASLGRKVGLTGPAIGGMEAGRIRPKRETICKLIKALDLTQTDYAKWSELSGYEIKADQINNTVLVSDKYKEIDSKKQKYSDQNSLMAVANFLFNGSTYTMITALMAVKAEDGVIMPEILIYELVQFAKANSTTLSVKTWKSIIADLMVNNR